MFSNSQMHVIDFLDQFGWRDGVEDVTLLLKYGVQIDNENLILCINIEIYFKLSVEHFFQSPSHPSLGGGGMRKILNL